MDCIILSSGKGTRTKLNYPKQLMCLGGKPILIHVLEVMSNIELIDNIIVTIPNDITYYTNLIRNYNIKNFTCILGGKTRQESTYNALQYCKSDKILIHESARPFINKEYVEEMLKIDADAVVPFITATQTIYYENKYINRDLVYNIQLPQLFKTDKLKLAHEKAVGKNYTDDSSLLCEELHIKPYFILGLENNIKITTPLDVKIAEVVYEEINSSNRR